VGLYHRVDIELGFFSSRANWGPPPTPSPADERLPPLGWRGGRTHLLAGDWVGGPNSNEGTDTVVL
jgi:hypothetical protein